MEGNVVVKEVTILETADDIQDRRDQVLSRYSQFRSEARQKRDKLEDSRRFQVEWTYIVMMLIPVVCVSPVHTCWRVHEVLLHTSLSDFVEFDFFGA